MWKVIEILKPHCKRILINEGADGDTLYDTTFTPVLPLGVCVQAIDGLWSARSHG